MTYKFADFELVTEDGTLVRRGIKVRLQDQPFRLLVLLLSRAGMVVSREEIETHLWPGNTNVEFDKGLRVAMSKLREALRDQADRPVYIETIPRRGYRFIAPVTATPPEPVSSAAAAPFAPTGQAILDAGTSDVLSTPAPATSRARRFKAVPAWAYGVTILLVGVGVFLGLRGQHAMQTPAVTQRPKTRLSVAVLGLRNLHGDARDQWLSTGLAEMLSSDLAASDQIRVISGEQVARAGVLQPLASSPSRETIQRLARQLGSDLILTGSYTVSPSVEKNPAPRLRIDLRLENPSEDSQPMVVVNTGSTADVFALVSAAGTQLRHRLGIEDTSTDGLVAGSTLPSDPVAAQLYAEALDRLRTFDALQARDLLQRAARIEPGHALTHLALADAWHWLGYDPQAHDEAVRAAQLSANLPRQQGLLIQGQSAVISHDWQHAIDIFRTLNTFYPDNTDYGVRLARAQVGAGKVDDGLATIQDIRHQSPSPADDARIELAEAYVQLHHNDYPKALAAAERALQLGTDLNQDLVRAEGLWMKACALERQGKSQESLTTSAEAQKLYGAGGDHRGLGVALLLSGDVLYDQGKFDDARKEFLLARDVFQTSGNAVNTGMTQERIGNSYFSQGKLAESRQLYEDSLKSFREAHWQEGIPSAIGNLANVLDMEGNIEGALRLNAEGLAEFEQSGQQRGYAATLANMGDLELERGELDAASQDYARAAQVDTKIGYSRGSATVLIDQAGLALERNDAATALARTQQASKILEGIDAPLLVAAARIADGGATVLAGRAQEAIPHLQEGIDLALKDKEHGLAVEGYIWLSRAWLTENRLSEASAAAQRAVDEAHQQFGPLFQLRAAVALARVKIAQGKIADGRDDLRAAQSAAERHGYTSLALEARILLARTDPATTGRRQLIALGNEASHHDWKLIAADAR